MNKLKDLELCKRIAEIEGVLVDTIEGEWLGVHGKYDIEEYNPLTDKALLFDLMVKYKVEIDYSDNDRRKGFALFKFDGAFSKPAMFYCGEEVPRAILECIVEASK